ncbi:MAG TPA: hypothetical protein VE890_17310, partial [Thermoguttaceae bacterium]|nr:hypothetical protein [Thermoguttaceae bacterium]
RAEIWGRLDRTPIFITLPQENVSSFRRLDAAATAWHFPNTDRAGLSKLFSRIGLSPALAETLKSMAVANPDSNGLVIRPTPEIVYGLSREDRSALYVALAKSPRNADHFNAFRLDCESPDQWFADSGVSPVVRKLVDPLIYRHEGILYFSDLRAIDCLVPTIEERWKLLKALSRRPTLLVRLTISKGADIESLVAYWGRGGRASQVRPILEALASGEDRGSIDIAQLLPPLPRSLLYTYPDPTENNVPLPKNCHWTSLNFFNKEPIDRFANPELAGDEVHANYELISDDPRLGDLVVLVDENERLIHTAVYIASDIVFTKNGCVSGAPWLLMEMEGIRHLYQPGDIRYFRRRDREPESDAAAADLLGGKL